MNKYIELRDRQQQEVNDFPMFFAFSKKQFEEGMARFGLKPDETDKIYKLGSTGGFYLRTDSEKLFEMFTRHEEEMATAIASDPTGDGFIFDMFLYELQNHEYGYTRDAKPTLDTLGMTLDKISADKRLLHGFAKAEKIARYNE